MGVAVGSPLGQGGDGAGKVGDEGGLGVERLREGLEGGDEDMGGRPVLRFHPVLLQQGQKAFPVGGIGMAGGVLPDGLGDGHPGEGGPEGEGPAVPLHLRRPQQGAGEPLQQLLRQGHQVLVVGVGLVEFQHRELGVVPRGDPLVAEVAVDLVHAVEPADDEALEEQFRGDAEVEVQIEGVVVGGEGLGGGPAREGLEHRGFHFEVAPGVEKRTQLAQEARPQLEDVPNLGVAEEVQMALAMPRLGVLELEKPLPLAGLDLGGVEMFLRKGAEALGQEDESGRLQGQLTRAGPEKGALHTDDVAQVQEPEGLPAGLADPILLEIGLEPLAAVGEIQKAGLAVLPDGKDPSRNGCRRRGGLQFLLRTGAERGDGAANGVGVAVFVGEDLDAPGFQGLELFAAHHFLVELFFHGRLFEGAGRVTAPV